MRQRPAPLHDDRVRVLMTFERGVPSRCDFEVAQLRRKCRVVEKDLARDLAKRRAALGFVLAHIHVAPA
jgi:hypothetical protein